MPETPKNKIQVLRAQPVLRLRRALDRVTSKRPDLLPVQAKVVRPLDLLAILGEFAEPALKGEPNASNKLRLTLTMMASELVGAARALASPPSGEVQAEEAPKSKPEGATPRAKLEDGLVVLGHFIVVGLAAGRVGRPQGRTIAKRFVDVMEGLALALAPAEVLSRAIESGMSDTELTALLDAHDGNGVYSVLIDGIESRRFLAVKVMLAAVRSLVGDAKIAFESALTHCIREARYVTKNNRVRLEVRVVTSPDEGEPSEKDACLGAALESGEALLVAFANERSTRPELVKAEVEKPAKGRPLIYLVTAAPPRDGAGWVGLVTPGALEAVTASWRVLREELAKLGDSVPTDVLDFELPSWPATDNGISWGARLIDLFAEQPSTPMQVGVPTTLTATYRGEPNDLEVSFVVDGESEPRFETTVTAVDRTATTTVPEDAVVQPFVARALLNQGSLVLDRREVDIELVVPPPPPPPAPDPPGKVVIRPVFVDGLRVGRAARGASASDEVELPYVADEDLVADLVDDPDGPAAARLLARLDRMAARTPGLEEATWAAVVPHEAAGGSFLRVVPGNAAAALILATDDQDLSKLPPTGLEPGARTRRLRLIGRITKGEILLTHPTRAEQRRAGAGAQFVSEFLAVGIDRAGDEVVARRVRTVSPTRTGPFCLLLPITDDVVAVELRRAPELMGVELTAQPSSVTVDLRSIAGERDDRAVGRFAEISRRGRDRPRSPLAVYRPAATIDVRAANLVGTKLDWKYVHSESARANIEVEVVVDRARGAFGSPLIIADPFRSDIDLSFAAGVDLGKHELRVVASDGWNAGQAKVNVVAAPAAPAPVRLIAIDEQRYFIDREPGVELQAKGARVRDIVDDVVELEADEELSWRKGPGDGFKPLPRPIGGRA